MFISLSCLIWRQTKSVGGVAVWLSVPSVSSMWDWGHVENIHYKLYNDIILPILEVLCPTQCYSQTSTFQMSLGNMIKILFLDLEFDLRSADPHWCNDPGSLQVLFASLEMRHPAHTFTYNGSLLYAILSDGKELGVFLGMSDSQETIPRMTSHSVLLVSSPFELNKCSKSFQGLVRFTGNYWSGKGSTGY